MECNWTPIRSACQLGDYACRDAYVDASRLWPDRSCRNDDRVFALFNRLGAIPGLIQKREITATLIRKVYGLLLLSNCILYTIVFVVSPYFAVFFNQPQLVEVVRVLGCLLLL